MKQAITILIIFSVFITFAQNVTKDELTKETKLLNEKLTTLQLENGKLKKEVIILSSKLSDISRKIENVQKQTSANTSTIAQTNSELGIKIQETGKLSENKIAAIDQSLSKKSLYGIIGVLLAILLSGLIYWLLSKRQKSDKSDVINQLSITKVAIEESLVKEFDKQTESMENQLLLLIEQQRTTQQIVPSLEPDHSLALKVASEINLIERNVKLMDIKTKGLKQLIASIGKLKDNLAANGYEMPELLGKQFHQGMKVIVTSSIPDDNLEKGSELITKVLIPQVNFNDKMIQTAQIEVSVG